MENSVFDLMSMVDPDMYVTGGAITVSEYEQNMDPNSQKKYEEALLSAFKSSFATDPYKGNLDFDHWLKSLNIELLEERARAYDDLRAENNGLQTYYYEYAGK
jgi:hypothetical protein